MDALHLPSIVSVQPPDPHDPPPMLLEPVPVAFSLPPLTSASRPSSAHSHRPMPSSSFTWRRVVEPPAMWKILLIAEFLVPATLLALEMASTEVREAILRQGLFPELVLPTLTFPGRCSVIVEALAKRARQAEMGNLPFLTTIILRQMPTLSDLDFEGLIQYCPNLTHLDISDNHESLSLSVFDILRRLTPAPRLEVLLLPRPKGLTHFRLVSVLNRFPSLRVLSVPLIQPSTSAILVARNLKTLHIEGSVTNDLVQLLLAGALPHLQDLALLNCPGRVLVDIVKQRPLQYVALPLEPPCSFEEVASIARSCGPQLRSLSILSRLRETSSPTTPSSSSSSGSGGGRRHGNNNGNAITANANNGIAAPHPPKDLGLVLAEHCPGLQALLLHAPTSHLSSSGLAALLQRCAALQRLDLSHFGAAELSNRQHQLVPATIGAPSSASSAALPPSSLSALPVSSAAALAVSLPGFAPMPPPSGGGGSSSSSCIVPSPPPLSPCSPGLFPMSSDPAGGSSCCNSAGSSTSSLADPATALVPSVASSSSWRWTRAVITPPTSARPSTNGRTSHGSGRQQHRTYSAHSASSSSSRLPRSALNCLRLRSSKAITSLASGPFTASSFLHNPCPLEELVLERLPFFAPSSLELSWLGGVCRYCSATRTGLRVLSLSSLPALVPVAIEMLLLTAGHGLLSLSLCDMKLSQGVWEALANAKGLQELTLRENHQEPALLAVGRRVLEKLPTQSPQLRRLDLYRMGSMVTDRLCLSLMAANLAWHGGKGLRWLRLDLRFGTMSFDAALALTTSGRCRFMEMRLMPADRSLPCSHERGLMILPRLQALVRAFHVRVLLRRMRDAAVRLQAVIRGYRARKAVRQEAARVQEAAVRVQAFLRGRQVRIMVQRQREACIRVQAAFRGFRARAHAAAR